MNKEYNLIKKEKKNQNQMESEESDFFNEDS